MTILKTEAFVLRTIKFKESSKIVTFYTKELGRVGAIVKGARRPKSKIGASLEPMSHVQIVLYLKEGREVQTVGQCDLLHSYHHFASDLEKLSVGLSIIELVYNIAHEQEQNIPLFDLINQTLAALNESSHNSLILFYFEMRLAELLGFSPVFTRCGNCKKEINFQQQSTKWYWYNLQKGCPMCEDCSFVQHGLHKISTDALTTLEHIIRLKSIGHIQLLPIERSTENEIEEFMMKYLEAHVSGFKQPRSRKIYHTRG
ncbi:MAG: DNA repair protein RecO [Ignavibacteriales bacterium]|nr:DNA repair protein RecO [Ignavibacteriales bacterium]